MHINRIIRRRIKDGLPYVFIILLVISILFFQMSHQFFVNGTDTFFHMSVTYDAYRQLKDWNFSYFLSAFGFYHSLRIVNAVYGPLGGYFSGLLLLITGNWARCEIAFFLIVFTIAGISMYQLCRYWNVTRVYSTLIGCLYIFSFPIMSLWHNSQYDGLGAIFMPWVLYFGSLMLNHELLKIWKLVLLLVILAEVHVFSLLLGLLTLGLCFVMSLIINRGRGKLILKAVKVLALTAILSFNVWGGILEVIGSNHGKIIPTYSFTNVFQDVWGSVFWNPNVPFDQNFFLLGISTSLLLLIIFLLYLLCRRNLNVPQHFIMIVLGIGFLWLSTRLFPWPLLQRHFPILDTDLQFPKRFLPVSLAAFGVMLGILLTTLQHRMHNRYFGAIVMTIILGMFVIHAWQNTQYQAQFLYRQQTSRSYYGNQFHLATGDTWMNNQHRPAQLINSYKSKDPERYFRLVTKATPDYMPTTQKIKTDAQYHKLAAYRQYDQQVVNNHLPYHINLSHHVVTVSFNRYSTRPVNLPFVRYAHTRIMMNGRPLHHPDLTQIGALDVKPRVGRNVVKFEYVPSKFYRIMIWISIMLWALFIVQSLFKGYGLFRKL